MAAENSAGESVRVTECSSAICTACIHQLSSDTVQHIVVLRSCWSSTCRGVSLTLRVDVGIEWMLMDLVLILQIILSAETGDNLPKECQLT